MYGRLCSVEGCVIKWRKLSGVAGGGCLWWDRLGDVVCRIVG